MDPAKGIDSKMSQLSINPPTEQQEPSDMDSVRSVRSTTGTTGTRRLSVNSVDSIFSAPNSVADEATNLDTTPNLPSSQLTRTRSDSNGSSPFVDEDENAQGQSPSRRATTSHSSPIAKPLEKQRLLRQIENLTTKNSQLENTNESLQKQLEEQQQKIAKLEAELSKSTQNQNG